MDTFAVWTNVTMQCAIPVGSLWKLEITVVGTATTVTSVASKPLANTGGPWFSMDAIQRPLCILSIHTKKCSD